MIDQPQPIVTPNAQIRDPSLARGALSGARRSGIGYRTSLVYHKAGSTSRLSPNFPLKTWRPHMVEASGLEPLTYCVQSNRSPN